MLIGFQYNRFDKELPPRYIQVGIFLDCDFEKKINLINGELSQSRSKNGNLPSFSPICINED